MLQGMLRRSKDWSDLFTRFPRTTSRLLSKAESGDLFQLTIKDLNRILSELDRLVTRLAISLMLSAIIIGMAMLTPLFSNGSLVQWLILLGFVSIFVLGVWFLISLIRSKKE
jgi:hypothetical protein